MDISLCWAGIQHSFGSGGWGSRERMHFILVVYCYVPPKVTPNLAAENNKLLLSHSFWRSGTWEQLSCMVLGQGLMRLQSSVSQDVVIWKLDLDYWIWFQDGWHMWFLPEASVPYWLLAEDLSSLHHQSPHMAASSHGSWYTPEGLI